MPQGTKAHHILCRYIHAYALHLWRKPKVGDHCWAPHLHTCCELLEVCVNFVALLPLPLLLLNLIGVVHVAATTIKRLNQVNDLHKRQTCRELSTL